MPCGSFLPAAFLRFCVGRYHRGWLDAVTLFWSLWFTCPGFVLPGSCVMLGCLGWLRYLLVRFAVPFSRTCHYRCPIPRLPFRHTERAVVVWCARWCVVLRACCDPTFLRWFLPRLGPGAAWVHRHRTRTCAHFYPYVFLPLSHHTTGGCWLLRRYCLLPLPTVRC